MLFYINIHISEVLCCINFIYRLVEVRFIVLIYPYDTVHICRIVIYFFLLYVGKCNEDGTGMKKVGTFWTGSDGKDNGEKCIEIDIYQWWPKEFFWGIELERFVL